MLKFNARLNAEGYSSHLLHGAPALIPSSNFGVACSLANPNRPVQPTCIDASLRGIYGSCFYS